MELQKNDHSLRPEVRYPVKKIIVAIVVSGCALGAHIFGIVPVAEAASLVISPETTYRKCFGGDRVTCVVDGDTLWIEARKSALPISTLPRSASRNAQRSWRWEIERPIA